MVNVCSTTYRQRLFSACSAFRALSEPVVSGGDIEKLAADVCGCGAFGIATNLPRFIAQALSA
jgi:hypothetical protein